MSSNQQHDTQWAAAFAMLHQRDYERLRAQLLFAVEAYHLGLDGPDTLHRLRESTSRVIQAPPQSLLMQPKEKAEALAEFCNELQALHGRLLLYSTMLRAQVEEDGVVHVRLSAAGLHHLASGYTVLSMTSTDAIAEFNRMLMAGRIEAGRAHLLAVAYYVLSSAHEYTNSVSLRVPKRVLPEFRAWLADELSNAYGKGTRRAAHRKVLRGVIDQLDSFPTGKQ